MFLTWKTQGPPLKNCLKQFQAFMLLSKMQIQIPFCCFESKQHFNFFKKHKYPMLQNTIIKFLKLAKLQQKTATKTWLKVTAIFIHGTWLTCNNTCNTNKTKLFFCKNILSHAAKQVLSTLYFYWLRKCKKYG